MAEAQARSVASYLNNPTDRPYGSRNPEFNTSIQEIRSRMRETRTTCKLYRDKLQEFQQQIGQLETMLKEQNNRVMVKVTDKLLGSNEVKMFMNYQKDKVKEMLAEGITLLEKADRITADIEELLQNLANHFPREDALSEIIRILRNMSDEPTGEIGLPGLGEWDKSGTTGSGIDMTLVVSVGVGVGVGLTAVLAGIFGGIGAVGSLGAALAGATVGVAFGTFVGVSIGKFITEIKSGKSRKETYDNLLISLVEFKSLLETFNGGLNSVLDGAGDQIRNFQNPLQAITDSYGRYLRMREQYRNSTDLREEEIQQIMIIASDCAQPIIDTFHVDNEHAWTIILHLKECAEP